MEKIIKRYGLKNKQELFEEMSNCIEDEVNESNWMEKLPEFERCYRIWIDFHREE